MHCAEAAGGTGTDQTMTGHTSGASHHTTGQTTGPMTGNTKGGTTQTSSHHTTGQHTGHGKHPSCNEDHEHTMACGLGMHQHVSLSMPSLADDAVLLAFVLPSGCPCI